MRLPVNLPIGLPVNLPLNLRLFAALLLLAVIAAPASADAATDTATDADALRQAQAEFRRLFAADERDVRRTRETDDDADFARQLLQEAKSDKHGDALTTVIYEQAYAYGLRDPKGFDTSDAALDALLERDAARKFEIGEMRLALWEAWHEAEPESRRLDPEDHIDLSMRLSSEAVAAGDVDLAMRFLNRGNRFASRIDSPRKHDVRDTITDLIRTREALDEIARLEEALATDPAAADQLALVYLADLDQPAKALAYAQQMQDPALAAMVRLAAADFKGATPEEAKQIGAFYFGLVTDSKTQDPIAMLIRARVWLTEFLSREQGEPDAIAAANETLAEVNEALLRRGIGKKLARKMSSRVRGDGRFDRPEDVQAAIDKAVAWLYEQRNDQRHWEQDQPGHRNWAGYTALVVYALLMADEEPRLNGDLSRSLHFMMNADMKGTYPLCFRIHAWEVLPHRERYRQTLMQDVLRLRKGSTRHGFWGYTMTGNDVKPESRLDVSTTIAGGLGLWIGEEVGGITPKKTYWERIARGLIEYQLDDNGWCYNPATGQTSQGAMTAGALALLYASYPHLGAVTQQKADEAIERGLKWMDEHFSSTTNVNRGGFKNYYFAAVQHAGLFAERKQFRDIDWYQAITEHLLKTQSANGSMGDVAETAFAVAFLCRGGVDYELSESEKLKAEAESEAGGN